MKKHRSVETDADDLSKSGFGDDVDEVSEDATAPFYSDDDERYVSPDPEDDQYQSSLNNSVAPGYPPPPPPPPRFCWFCWFLTISLFLVSAAAYLILTQWQLRDPDGLGEWLCEEVLSEEQCPKLVRDVRIIIGDDGPPIVVDDKSLKDWVTRVHPEMFLENKFRSLKHNYSVIKNDISLNTGNVLLGLYEADALKRPAEAAVHYLLAGINGDYDARELFEGLSLDEADKSRAQDNLVEILKINGGEGYFKLSQLYLGVKAIDRTTPNYPASNSPKYARYYPYSRFDNNFLVEAPDYSMAYRHMYVAVQCNQPSSYEWLGYITEVGGLTGLQQALNREAQNEINDRINLIDGGLEAFCKGEVLSYRVQQLTNNNAVIWRFLSDRRPWPTMGELVEKLKLPEPEFFQWIGILVTEAVEQYGYQGSSRYYGSPQDYPFYGRSADATRLGRAPDSGVRMDNEGGVPEECENLAPGERCPATPAAAARRAADARCEERALTALNTGKALITRNPDQARRNLRIAIDDGNRCQAEAARQASLLMQRLNLACSYTPQSLARISRNAENNPEGGAIISLRARQSALAAFGYYTYNIDGKYGPQTREAVEQFQQEYGYLETGVLTPEETVHLFCYAGDQLRDLRSLQTLGLMYAAGLGTVQDLDAGVRRLELAGRRGDSSANYNLALIYGTGTVAASYHLCDVPENLQRADSYLEEAANAGHPGANELIRDYGSLLVSERWDKIKERLELDDFHKSRMATVGEACTPNP